MMAFDSSGDPGPGMTLTPSTLFEPSDWYGDCDWDFDFSAVIPEEGQSSENSVEPTALNTPQEWSDSVLGMPVDLECLFPNGGEKPPNESTEQPAALLNFPQKAKHNPQHMDNVLFSSDNQRWHATLNRSRQADSFFLYGVSTTKICCRPSCASRRPARRHVRFFPFPGAIEAAEQAKFRPCKRCQPGSAGAANAAVHGICKVLRAVVAETLEGAVSQRGNSLKLDSLAKSAAFSTFHFHRVFKATTQVTPGDFIQACRALALQDALGRDRCYNSQSSAEEIMQHFAPWSPRMARKALGGLSTIEYANGSPDKCIEICSVTTPHGKICIAYSMDDNSASAKLHAVLLGHDPEANMHIRFPAATPSSRYKDFLLHLMESLEERCRDRDAEITADISPILWRARVWVELVKDWGR